MILPYPKNILTVSTHYKTLGYWLNTCHVQCIINAWHQHDIGLIPCCEQWFFWSCATYAVISCQSFIEIWYFFAVLVFVASSLARKSVRVDRTRVVSVGFPIASATLHFKGDRGGCGGSGERVKHLPYVQMTHFFLQEWGCSWNSGVLRMCFVKECGRRGVVVRLLDDTLPARDMNVE